MADAGGALRAGLGTGSEIASPEEAGGGGGPTFTRFLHSRCTRFQSSALTFSPSVASTLSTLLLAASVRESRSRSTPSPRRPLRELR